MNFSIPVHFQPHPTLTQPTIKGISCLLPQTWWQAQPELGQLNALRSMAEELDGFTYWEGVEGQKDANPDSENMGEYPDVTQFYQQALDSIEKQVELLRQSQGRLDQLLRLHWPDLEAGYRTLKRHAREFVLGHQSEEVYVTQLSEAFKAHVASWRLQLGLLWLELEEQSR